MHRRALNEPSARSLLLVDFKNHLWRAAASHEALFSGRTFTGGLYGFLVSVCRAVIDLKITAVAVGTDSPPYVRKAEFAGYKAGRKDKVDEAMLMKVAQTQKLAIQLLDVLDIPLWRVEAFEYDDICAWAARRFCSRFDHVYASTNDSDLYQLFDVAQFKVYRGVKKGVYTRADFVTDHGDLTPEQWVRMLAMTGTHNAVPGIVGIGPVTARKALSDGVALRRILEQHSDVVARNVALIELPHKKFPADPGLRLRTHAFEIRDAVIFASKYDIQVTRNMVEAFSMLRGKK